MGREETQREKMQFEMEESWERLWMPPGRVNTAAAGHGAGADL